MKYICCLILAFNFYMMRSQTDPRIAPFEQELIKLQKIHKVSGFSIAILSQGEIIYSKGFGWANIETGKQMEDSTRFRIASITKPIASTLLLQLVDKGSLDLDWPIRDLHPNYEETFQRIKKDLNENEPEYAFLINNYDFHRTDITLRHHLTHVADGVPGEHFAYNGFLYGRLSKIFPNIHGKDFETTVKEELIQNLSLSHTLTHIDAAGSQEILAQPHIVDQQGKWILGEHPNASLNAGAGLISNVFDLAKFDKALDEGKFLKKSTLEKAFTRAKNNAGEEIPYGLGWFVSEYQGNKVVYHTGWWPNAYSGLYLKVPEKRLTMIILSNCGNIHARFNEEIGQGNIQGSPFGALFLNTFLVE